MFRRLTAKITGQSSEGGVRNFQGLPPQLTGGQDHRIEMGKPSLLLIQEKADGVFLYRFTNEGQFAGDTWHRDVAEAEEQAAFEFGGNVSSWTAVPEEIRDAVAFGMKL